MRHTHTVLSCPAHVYVCESVYRTRPSPGGGSGTGALSYVGPESCNGANASCIGTDSPVRSAVRASLCSASHHHIFLIHSPSSARDLLPARLGRRSGARRSRGSHHHHLSALGRSTPKWKCEESGDGSVDGLAKMSSTKEAPRWRTRKWSALRAAMPNRFDACGKRASPHPARQS